MAPLGIFKRSKGYFVTLNVVVCMLAFSCDRAEPSEGTVEMGHPAVKAAEAPIPVDDKSDSNVDSVGAVDVGAPPASDPTPVFGSVHQDLVVQQHELVKQSAKVEGQAKKADADIAQIRLSLIERRLARLADRAEDNGWADKPPAEGSSDWKDYTEWKYIIQNRASLQQGAKPEPCLESAPAAAPAPMLLPIPRPKSMPKPDWKL